MEMAKGLSLRGRFAPVAISGRQCRFVPAAVKMARADCVCSGAHCAAVGGFAALRKRRAPCGLWAPCRLALFEAQIHWRKDPKFVIPRSEATWESPAAGYVFAEAYLLFNMVLRDCHVGCASSQW